MDTLISAAPGRAVTQTSQTILMCAPDFFGVDYVINPWMAEGLGKTDRTGAVRQWENLKKVLGAETNLAFVSPQKGLPDMVFTANAGLVLGKKVVVSRFRSKERQGEEPFFADWFRSNGFEIVAWPKNVAFEGAGDALFDRGTKILWAGHGFRSDEKAAALLEMALGCRTIGLHLIDPRFYHLDTCLCPLTGGYLMYFPQAFDDNSRKKIEAAVPPEKRIAVGEQDALFFACNAVDLNGKVFLNNASEVLQAQLTKAGFTPVLVPLSEFLKSGGAAKCLTLKLVEI
jgi:N-dimethylarginine dimethylaminohydrolase